MAENDMKFVIKKGSETFDKLSALQDEMHKVHQKTAAFVEKHGATRWMSTGSLAGGFRGIRLENKPADWKEVHYGYYFPKKIKKNQEVLDKIYALPTLDNSAINSIIGFGGFQITNSMRVIHKPGFCFGTDYHLIEFPEDAEYTPNDDMEEITVSEYKRLEKEILEKEEKLSKNLAEI